MPRLAGKVCLITGAARGQGAAEARLFAAEGGIVWMTDVLDDEGQDLASEIGARYRHLDVRDEMQWSNIVGEIIETDARLDVLINNAGIFLGMRTVAPQMIKGGSGSIVNISSLAGMRAAVGSFAYGASKWAVRGMTKTAAVELARKGVRVNSIHPGLIETPMAEQISGGLDRVARRTPLGRVAQAEEVAAMALFLASDESSYSTGSEFQIDGGLNAL